MTEVHDSGELSCPRCGVPIEDVEIPSAEVVTAGEELRVGLECPDCGSDLELVVRSAAPKALGVDVWLEDRRESDS